ncbi:MAG: hypothetical protein GF398_18010 [Chitinivibrionales bacterium]|nr:hypothetical protein [Chitinivibrionales bacterium]
MLLDIIDIQSVQLPSAKSAGSGRTKGDIPCPAPNVRPESVISSKRKRHSQKPDDIFRIIESAYPILPKCELFARKKRKGWKC